MEIQIRGRGKPYANGEILGDELRIRVDDDANDELWYELRIGRDVLNFLVRTARPGHERDLLKSVNDHLEGIPGPSTLTCLCSDLAPMVRALQIPERDDLLAALESCRKLGLAMERFGFLSGLTLFEDWAPPHAGDGEEDLPL